MHLKMKDTATGADTRGGKEIITMLHDDTPNTTGFETQSVWAGLPARFVNWQFRLPKPPSTKMDKVPFDARTGKNIDPHAPSQWFTLQDAVKRDPSHVGFVLTEADDLFVIDIDGVYDPAKREWDPRVSELSAMFPGAFYELSVSQSGAHIWGRCDKQVIGKRRKKFTLGNGLKIEAYTYKRFIALGHPIGGDINLNWTATLAGLLPIDDTADTVPLSDTVDPQWSGPTGDDELLALAMKSKGGIAAHFGDAASFADLFTANVAVLSRCYPSVSGGDFDHSSADQALCNALAFWCGKSAARMDRLFRRSGLYRQKWERADYRGSTISNAVSSTRNVFSRPTTLPAGVTAPLARSFEDILSDANNIAADDVPAIERLCDEAAALPPIRKDAILRQIRVVTGISMAELKKAATGQDSTSEPDHRELAQKTIAAIGLENIVHAGQSSWKFDQKGVWKQCDDRELKQRVQTTLAAEDHVVTAARVSGVAEVLKNEIFKADHEFNRGNPESVNCLNGELELVGEQWQLVPHRRELYRTTQIPIAFDPEAAAPLFWQFLNDIFRDDADRNDKIAVVLEMMGYSLMGHARREKFMLLIGAGANGKSVVLATLEALLGKDNVAGVQPANFDNRFQRGHLDQKLANIVTELKQGETIADAELKAITSGEPATVEHKNKDPFVMRPFATCWFGTNHMPHTRDYSDAFFRRAIVVPFNRIFAQHEQDPGLKEKLANELPGILNYALWAYAQVVKRGGFTVPASSLAAQRKWQIEANQVAQFVEDRCDERADGKATIDMLYSLYQGWAQGVGVRQTLGQRHFCDRLEQLGFPRAKGSAGVRTISGLALKAMPVS